MNQNAAGTNDPELQKKMQEKLAQMYLEEKKLELMRKYLEPAAYDRITNVKNVNKQLYDGFVEVVLGLVNSGRLRRQLTENETVALLQQMSSRREPKIEIRRK